MKNGQEWGFATSQLVWFEVCVTTPYTTDALICPLL